jgi:SsrA-binding protein
MKTPLKKTPVIENKKSRRNYEIIETLEAGIVLKGSEVKSLRLGRGEISDAYATPFKSELMLLNLRIDAYANAGYINHEETRTRKLLLHKKEILKLITKIKEKSLTVIPLKIYFNDRGKVKVLLGVGRGKKLADRREDEKKQEAKREIDRALKSANRN